MPLDGAQPMHGGDASGTCRAYADAAPPPPPSAAGGGRAAASPPDIGTKSQAPAIAIVVAAASSRIGAGAWFVYAAAGRGRGEVGQRTDGGSSAPLAPPAAPPCVPARRQPAGRRELEPGTMLISAVGLVDPSDPRYQGDKALLQGDLRADSKSQLVAEGARPAASTPSRSRRTTTC